VTTDHDRMADYRPLATALGLDSRFQVIPGVEVSPVLRGHFNLFPVEPRPQTLLNGGAESWWFIPENQDELFERIYASGSSTSLLQVNHGRGGMMSFASYSPGTGEVSDPDLWSWDFELFELINATSRGDFAELREDYFSFLNQGYRKVPTGVSDSHGRSSPCGYGRTDVFLDTEDPSSVTPAQLQEALQAGHVIVAGGITLRASSGSSLPGDELVGESHELVASVRAPDWMRPEEVRLIRDGVLVSTVELPDEPEEGALWWEGSFVLEPEEDAWYVVEVEGSQALGGVWGGGVPYAITNAFFVDVGGDGWTPPGL